MHFKRAISLISAAATACLLLAGAPATAQGQGDHKTTKGKSKPRFEDSVTEEYRVKTKWGTIYGIVQRPVVPKGRKVPVILTYSPYNILDGPTSKHMAPIDNHASYFVPRGYARAWFDLVGTNGSSGCYDYGGIRERQTGKAVLDFLGSRRWSNGRVGMIGGSYDGTTQWAAAVETPKHLTTIIPQVAIGRWWNYAFHQGVRYYSGSGTPYLFDFGFGFLPPTHSTVPDPQAVVDHIRPCERIKHNERAFLPDPVYDGWWDERDYLRRIHKVRASVMIEGSWVDYNVHPINSYEMWAGLPDGHPKRFVMAQQGHRAADFPDSRDIVHAWFDHWLLRLDTGVMDLPRVDTLTNTRQRFQSHDWPPAGTKTRPLALSLKPGKNALELTDASAPTWTDNNPALTDFLSLRGLGGSADLLFVGKPVRKQTRIAGLPVLDVTVTTNLENTWITPVLFDESPSGTRRWITKSLLNARNRFGDRKSIPLVPGQPWRGRAEFQPVDYILEPGHRLGVAIMSMNGNEALYWSALPATNTLHLKRSKLVVPFAPLD